MRKLIFGKPEPWEDDPSVIQQLVFINQAAKDLFDKTIEERVDTIVIENSNKSIYTLYHSKYSYSIDSNAGALFKLRAVKNGIGKWDPLVRCGVTGNTLVTGRFGECVIPEEALIAAKDAMYQYLKDLASED